MRYLSLVSAYILLSSTAYAMERTQTIELKKGWNAIYLEVDPVIEKQDLSTFLMPTGANGKMTITPIEMIATYYPNTSPVEYISDPSNIGWKKATWNRWVRDDLPEAFLSNLYNLQAHQGYLIKSSKAFVWQVKGEVVHRNKAWQPNSFNLRGFPVKASGASFYQLFQENSVAEALINSPVYSLVDGKWTKINMVDEAVQENKAYWVYSDNTAEFQGNLELEISNGASSVSFLDIVNIQSIKLTNRSKQPISVTVTLENNTIPLSLVGQDALFTRTYTPVDTIVDTIELQGETHTTMQLSVRRNEIGDNTEQKGLLKFVVAQTNETFWVSLSAFKGGN